MASLKDIASAAGVSIRTVSRALKEDGYVSPGTRHVVLAAAERLGYTPNRHARSLRTRRSHEVAVLLWSLDELHVAKVAAFERAMRRGGYAVSMLFGGVEGSRSEELLAELMSRRPAGVCILGSRDLPVDLPPDRWRQADVPRVLIDAAGAADSVQIDRPRGVAEAVAHLAATGRRRIAYVGATDESRLSGYRRALAEAGLAPVLIGWESEHDQFEGGRSAARRLAQMDPCPDAVQAFSDVTAMGLLYGLHERGLRVPVDVAVVGFDDRRAASLSWPRLTTVAQPNAEVGRAAAEILLAKIAGQDAPEGGWGRTVSTRLVIRESA